MERSNEKQQLDDDSGGRRLDVLRRNCLRAASRRWAATTVGAEHAWRKPAGADHAAAHDARRPRDDRRRPPDTRQCGRRRQSPKRRSSRQPCPRPRTIGAPRKSASKGEDHPARLGFAWRSVAPVGWIELLRNPSPVPGVMGFARAQPILASRIRVFYLRFPSIFPYARAGGKLRAEHGPSTVGCARRERDTGGVIAAAATRPQP
jgi:hypothetical protein